MKNKELKKSLIKCFVDFEAANGSTLGTRTAMLTTLKNLTVEAAVAIAGDMPTKEKVLRSFLVDVGTGISPYVKGGKRKYTKKTCMAKT